MVAHLPFKEVVNMRKIFVACAMLFVTLVAGTAVADSIEGRIGVTGRLGFLVPADSDQVGLVIAADADVRDFKGNGKISNFDPSGVSVTAGVRYFFN
jgi:hypothetical protein